MWQRPALLLRPGEGTTGGAGKEAGGLRAGLHGGPIPGALAPVLGQQLLV